MSIQFNVHKKKPVIAHIIRVIILPLFFVGHALIAQHYNFIHYSTESGLAQSQVRCIAQDKNGSLWLGTLAGLTKYDGNKFSNYSIKNGLIDNQIFSMILDKRTGIWIGTQGGINYYNGSTFTAYRFKPEMAESQVNAITQDTNHKLWLATDGAGVVQFDGKGFRYFTSANGLPDDFVRTTCTDAKGNVWIGTRNGICFYNGKTFQRIDSSLKPPQNVSHIYRDRQNRLWFCTFGEGIFCFDGKTFAPYTEAQGLISNWIRSAVEDADGNIWLASRFGVCRFNGQTFTSFTEAEGLPVDNTNVVYEDRERNIWIGSDGKGLCKFLGETFTNLTVKDQLSSNIVLSVCEDENKSLWVGTFGKGLTQLTGTKANKYSADNGLNSNTIWASLKDKQQRLWFCTADGISCWNGKKFINYGQAEGVGGKTVYSACEDAQGNIWFGTTQGLSVFDGQQFKNYISGKDNIGKDVTNIVKDKNNTLWFASKNGLYSFNKGVLSHYTASKGLSTNHLTSLAIDSSNRLWIGSRGGISYYDGKTFSKVELDNVFNANTVYFLIFDSKGLLWIGTNGGIFAFDTQTYLQSKKIKFRHFTIFDGLAGMECNQNAAFKDHNDNIWMGTTEGLIKYNSNLKYFRTDTVEPITHISGVRLFLKDTNWLKMGKTIDSLTLLPKNLKVNYQTRYFTFDYIGIKLSNPNSVRYKYMLEGFDETWSASTEAQFATYSNLPSGVYTFKVVAGDVMGNWNKTPVTFSFEILPPFWTTWWFILLGIALGVLILWSAYRLRVSELRKKHLTQQLDFKSKLMALEHQSLNSSMNRHFIFNALNSIQYYMNVEDKQSAHKYLSRFAKLIRMNLDSSLSTLVPVSEEITRLELYLQLEQMRFEDKFEYKIVIDKNLDIESVEIPPMLLQPYIENSIWHGVLPSNKTGQIDIKVGYNAQQHIVFSIEDNGIGMEASKARKSLQKDLHISRGTFITAQRIHLLGQMNNIAITINGPFDVKNAENKVLGTRVELIIR